MCSICREGDIALRFLPCPPAALTPALYPAMYASAQLKRLLMTSSAKYQFITSAKSSNRAYRQAGNDNCSLDCGRHYFTAFWDLRFAPAAVFVVPLPGTEAVAGGAE